MGDIIMAKQDLNLYFNEIKENGMTNNIWFFTKQSFKNKMIIYYSYIVKQYEENLSHENFTDFYYKKDSLTEKIFLKLKDAGTFSELAEALIDTEYYAALKPFIGEPERQNLFEIETALDMMMNKLCIKYINTLLSKEEAKIVMRSYGIRSDLELIMFILRSKKYYGFTPKQIYPHINIHTYRLKEEDIKAMANANNQEEILNIVKTTPYKRVFSDKADFYEKSISKFILEIHHSLYRKNPYSIEAILFYIALKNVEINNITALIEGIRYGLAPEEIREHLIIIK